MFNFDELEDTRPYMLQEFRSEQASTHPPPFRPANLSPRGQAAFADIMERAIAEGNEETLVQELSDPALWIAMESYITKTGKIATRSYSANDRARRFSITDFNTWYVRGFCHRLMDEGVEECEVYRAAPAYQPRSECRTLEGGVLSVREVYEGHRAKYHPMPNPGAFSIPVGPNCHHSIRRLVAAHK
jgi:hypothetical protein